VPDGGLLDDPPGRHPPDHFLADSVRLNAQAIQYLGGGIVAFADQAQQDVLAPDEVIAERDSLAQRQLQRFLCPRYERDVPARRLVLAPADDLLYLLARRLFGDPERFQRAGCCPRALVDQGEQMCSVPM
jgi:hypothetical protein